jgi:hypothetical protein
VREALQLEALGELNRLFQAAVIDYWVFGGWAVDLHAGERTRPHEDLDLAIWLHDYDRAREILAAARWRHEPEPDDDGSTTFARGSVRLELAFLARDERGDAYTPVRGGRAGWAQGAFENDVGEVRGVRARVISLRALRAEKSEARSDPVVAAKDRADVAILDQLP